jgi:hypothetical protein
MTATSTFTVCVSPDPLELALLQHAQQLHLELRLQRPDLVEKDRPAVGGLEAADLVADGAGERALHVAEDFRLQQRARSARRS